MDPITAKKKIDQLTTELKRYNHAFFQEATSLVSDYLFDKKMKELEELERLFPAFRHADSPTQSVGEETTSGFQSIAHQFSMRSLANTYTLDAVKAFVKRGEKQLQKSVWPLVGEFKLDGVALSLVYQKGRLAYILTRGNGQKGDDVGRHAPIIEGVPQKLPTPFDGMIRGEVVMLKTAFEKINQALKGRGERVFANPRNLAAGTLKTQDPALVSNRQLQFYGYTLESLSASHTTQIAGLHLLKAWGVQIVPHHALFDNIDALGHFLKTWEKKRTQLPFQIDGIVLKVNNRALQNELGATTKNPRWAIAYKYAPAFAVSRLNAVTYQVGRTGVVTPVAEIEPIHLAGSTIRRASLYHADHMAALGVSVGDRIRIEKGGDVIPKITAVLREKAGTGAPCVFPSHCPSCAEPLTRMPDQAHWYCLNPFNCAAQKAARITHFASKEALHIDTLGPKRIDQLLNAGLIETPADLYQLQRADLLALDGMQERSAKQLLEHIERSKKSSLARLIYGLGIRYIGEQVAHLLAGHFDTLQQLRDATLEELKALPQIGEQMADSIQRFFSNPRHQQVIHTLSRLGIGEKTKRPSAPSDGALQNKKIVITGTFSKYTRRALQEKIRTAGALLTKSVSSQTAILLSGDRPGPDKTEQAKKHGVAIWDIDQLEKVLG